MNSDGISEAPAAAQDSRPTVRLLHHLARTGGTIISRCLGAMDGIVLLSEINPRGAHYINPLQQAHQWFALLTPEDLRSMQSGGAPPFDQAIALIEARCRESGRRLVLRDWTHVDYTGVPFVSNPAYELSLTKALAERFRTVGFATVRHPVDQWLSLQRLALVAGKIALETFLHGCCRFAREAARMGFVRYEDFARDPDAAMREICARLEVPFDPGFAAKWQDNKHVTGDVENVPLARIGPATRRPAPPELLARFAPSNDYRETLELLGYEHPQEGAGA